MHRSPYILMLAVSTVTLAACNPFRSPFKQSPVVEVDTRDVNVNARWNGTLASPSSLSGAVQMKGSASMAPGRGGENAFVSVDLSNASPGGVHPWQLRLGQCGQDRGLVGSAESYKALKVDEEGRASSSVTLPVVMPTEGSYYVTVSASAANAGTTVACGNLAAPSR